MMTTRQRFIAVGAVLLVFLSLAVDHSAAQRSTDSGGTGDQIDPALAKSRDIELLTGRIREEFLRGNLEQARALCKQTLQIDPENTMARLFLSMAERKLKGPTGTTDSAVSALPKSPYMETAIEMARPTTPTALLPSERPQGYQPGTRPPTPRPAAVDGTAPSTASTPFWLRGGTLKWAIIILIALVGGLALVIMLDRLFAGKRQRTAQAQFFDHMRAAAGSVQAPTGEASEVPAPVDDFPIGVSVPVETPESNESPSALDAVTDEGGALDYWDDSDSLAEPAAAADAQAEPAVDENDFGAIAIEEAFAGDIPEFSHDERGQPAQPSLDEVSPFDVSEPDAGPSPHAEEEPIDVRKLDEEPVVEPAVEIGLEEDDEDIEEKPSAVFLVTTDPEEAAPITIEGFDFETPSPDMTEAEEDAGPDDARRDLREESVLEDSVVLEAEPALDGLGAAAFEDLDLPEGEESEKLPLPLEKLLADTQTLRGDQEAKESEPPILNGTPPPEPAVIEFEEPPSPEAQGPADSPSLFAETVVLGRKGSSPGTAAPKPPAGSGDMELSLDDPEAKFDEILISGGREPEPDQVSEPLSPDAASESTMVDSKSRHKAVFQDQLARGMAAMEKEEWKEAVKYLAVAHAMDPTDNYARGKLREAREKQAKAR